jgi:hypothetical protein
VRIEKTTIIATRNDYETLIPLLCLAYQKVHPFVKTPINRAPKNLMEKMHWNFLAILFVKVDIFQVQFCSFSGYEFVNS